MNDTTKNSKELVFKAKEKLSKLTILLFVILDIFVFFLINKGLDFHTNFVNTPKKQYTNSCMSVFKANLEDFSSSIYNNKFSLTSNDFYDEFESNFEELDERCKLIDTKLQAVLKEHNIEILLKLNKQIESKLYQIGEELEYLKDKYNTVLFETIAKEEFQNSEDIKEKYQRFLNNYEKLKQEKEHLLATFKESSSVKELTYYVNSQKDKFLKDEEEASRIYFSKVEMLKLSFLLPLLFVFFYFMKNYLKKEEYLLHLVFKNVFIMTLIPTFIAFISMIYKFLPKIFISRVVEFFYEFKISFILYYLVTAFFILLFIFIILKVQKAFKEENGLNKDNKLYKIKFYNQNLCTYCGNKVSYGNMNFCHICGNKLSIECKSCKKDTFLGFDFCKNCGEKL